MKASTVNEAARLIHGAADRNPTGLALLLAREGRLVGAHQAEELDRLEALVPELQARVAVLESAPVLAWAAGLDDLMLAQFLNRLGEAAVTDGDARRALAFVQALCATWQGIAKDEAQGAAVEAPHPAPCRTPDSPWCRCGPIDGPQPADAPDPLESVLRAAFDAGEPCDADGNPITPGGDQ